MSIVGEAFVRIRPNSTGFTAETAEGVKSGLGKISNILGLGLAVGVGEVLKKSLEAADSFEKSEARLKTAIKDTGGQFDAYRGQIDKANAQGQKFGHSNADIEDALAQLTLRTGNAKTAFKDLNIVEDVSAGLHKDLSSSITLIAKAEAGSATALKRLGINFQSTGDKAKDAAAIIKLLGERFAGQAQSQAETFAGKMAALRAELTNVEQKIGLAVIPVIQDLGTALGNTIDFVARNKTAFEILGGVIGLVLLPAIEAYAVAQAKAFAESAITFVTKLGTAIGLVRTEVVATTFSMEGLVVEEETAAAVNFAGLGAGILAAAAPLAVLTGGFLILKAQLDNNKRTAQSWADEHIAAAKKSGNEIAALEVIEKHEVHESNLGWKLKLGPVQIFTDEHAKHADARRKDIEKEIALNKQSHDEAVGQLADIGAAFTSNANTVTIFGETVDTTTKEGKKRLGELQSEAKKLRDAFEQSFAQSDTAMSTFFGHIKDKGTETLNQLEADIKKQTANDAKFAADFQQLLDAGVRGPLLEEVRKAGPQGVALVDELVAGLKTGQTQRIGEELAVSKGIADNLASATDKIPQEYQQTGQAALNALFKGITDINVLDQIVSSLNQAGQDAARGYLAGIGDYIIRNADGTASVVTKATKDAMKRAGEIKSPSALFAREVGAPIGEGILHGLTSTLAGFSTGTQLSSIGRSIRGAVSGIGGYGAAGAPWTIAPGAIVVHVGPGVTAPAAAQHFEQALSRILVRTRMGTGARG